MIELLGIALIVFGFLWYGSRWNRPIEFVILHMTDEERFIVERRMMLHDEIVRVFLVPPHLLKP